MSSFVNIEFLPFIVFSVLGGLVVFQSKSSVFKILFVAVVISLPVIGIFSEYKCDRSLTNVIVRFAKGDEPCPIFQSSPSDELPDTMKNEPEISPDTRAAPSLSPQPPSDPWNFLEIRSKSFPVDTLEPNTHYVRRDIVGQLNIRNGPGEEYRIVGHRDGGKCVRVIGVDNGWATVAMPTASGPYAYYASSRFLIPIQPGQRCE